MDRILSPDMLSGCEPGSVNWAVLHSQRLLDQLPKRWAHTQEVARHARWAAAGLPPDERHQLIAAAYLHDIGYAEAIAGTGFHPLDGARYLRSVEQFELACLVAHHSGAAIEAVHRELADELAEFPKPAGAVADALTFCDVTSGPKGQPMSPGDRFAEIVDRHGQDSVVVRSRAEARTELYGAVARTLRRVSAVKPPPVDLRISRVMLGCSTLIRIEGPLTEAYLDWTGPSLRDAFSSGPHRAVCDLSLVGDVDDAGVTSLLNEARRAPATDVVLADAPLRFVKVFERMAPPRVHLTAGIEEALVPHCS